MHALHDIRTIRLGGVKDQWISLHSPLKLSSVANLDKPGLLDIMPNFGYGFSFESTLLLACFSFLVLEAVWSFAGKWTRGSNTHSQSEKHGLDSGDVKWRSVCNLGRGKVRIGAFMAGALGVAMGVSIRLTGVATTEWMGDCTQLAVLVSIYLVDLYYWATARIY